jgi:hypothetical protein
MAFIDDDELPVRDWLSRLYDTCVAYKAAGALGPVLPCYEIRPPRWVLKGRFCERPSYRTGTVMHWSRSRTGNVLLDRRFLPSNSPAFNPAFRIQGEDVHFFKTMHHRGATFVWCNEAPVYESVAPARCTPSYFVRRAFVQGNTSARYNGALTPRERLYVSARSIAAVCLYTTLLPVTLLAGPHLFMKYLIKNVHHFSRLLALLHLVSLKQRNL